MGQPRTAQQFLIALLCLIATSVSGAISLIGGGASVGTNCLIESTTANDVILVFAYSSTTTIPSLASGYTDIANAAGTQQAYRVAWKFSSGGETSSGTWANANWVTALIYRGTNTTSPIGATSTGTAGNSATLTYTGITCQDSSGNSWIAAFGGAKSATAGMNSGTTNLTLRENGGATGQVNALDSNGGVTSLSNQTLTVTGSGRWFTATVEIKAPAVPLSAARKASFFPFIRP